MMQLADRRGIPLAEVGRMTYDEFHLWLAFYNEDR